MFEKEIKLLDELLKIAKNRDRTEINWLEFKVNNISQIGEYISALGNSAFWSDQEYGYLVFGIEDSNHNQIGVNDFDVFNIKRDGKHSLEVWLSQKITGCTFEFLPFQKNSLNFLIVKVSSIYSTIAKFEKNGYFRIGSNQKLLKDIPEWESKLWTKILNQKPKTIFTKILKPNIDKEDVLRLLDYRTYYKLTSGNEKMEPPRNLNLILDKFLDEGFIIKNGKNFDILGIGAVLFANYIKDFGELQFKAPEVLTYDGNNKLDPVVRTQIGSKGYAVGFLGLIDYIFTQIKQPESINKLRSKKPTYPEKSIREIVANALIHQDFEIGSRVLIEIYDNHIDISNGGGCLFDAGRIIDHSPKSRNEPLAEAMRRLNICERRGSGVDRTIDAIQKLQLPPPKFVDQGDAFVVKMYTHKKYAEFTEEEKQRACMQFVELNFELGKPTTNEELRVRFGLSEKQYPMVSRLIKKCIDRGLIKVFDPNNKSKKFTVYVPYFA